MKLVVPRIMGTDAVYATACTDVITYVQCNDAILSKSLRNQSRAMCKFVVLS